MAEGGCPKKQLPVVGLGDSNPLSGVATSPLLDPKEKQGRVAALLPTWLPDSPMESPLKGCPEGPPENPPKGSSGESSAEPHGCPTVSSALHGPTGGGGTAEAALRGFDPLAATSRHCILLGDQERQVAGRPSAPHQLADVCFTEPLPVVIRAAGGRGVNAAPIACVALTLHLFTPVYEEAPMIPDGDV